MQTESFLQSNLLNLWLMPSQNLSIYYLPFRPGSLADMADLQMGPLNSFFFMETE